ncbi:MAG: type VI secretion system tube protein Hcp [Verrucomicrobiae bacterium]|nr:type VI secretion system tube protein Hcp [Verrucomicrobiae bacterium]
MAGVLASGPTFDGYLEITGIPGDAEEVSHQDWIRIHGFSNRVDADPAIRRPAFEGICISKSTDRATPLLLQHCARGTRLSQARLEFVTADPERLRFYSISLTNVLVRSIQSSGTAARTARPGGEEICLTFSAIQWSYTEWSRSGMPAAEIRAWWDLAAGRGGADEAPGFRLMGTMAGFSEIELTWLARAGRTYHVLGGSHVSGPYEPVQIMVVSASGPASVRLPFSGGHLFIWVRESGSGAP